MTEIDELKKKIIRFRDELNQIYKVMITEARHIKDSDALSRNLFIVTHYDFLYIDGSYYRVQFFEAEEEYKKFKKIFEEEYDKLKQTTNHPIQILILGLSYFIKSIEETKILKEKLSLFKKHYEIYKKRLHLNDEELSELNQELNNIAISELYECKCKIILEFQRGLVYVLDHIWQTESLQSLARIRDAFKKLKNLLKDFSKEPIDLFKYTVTALHDTLCFTLCLIKEAVRVKYKRSFINQETHIAGSDCLLFHLFDFLKLQPRDVDPITNTNILQLYEYIEYSLGLKYILILSFMEIVNIIETVSSSSGYADLTPTTPELKPFLAAFQNKVCFSYFMITQKYKYSVWHMSIARKPLPITYPKYTIYLDKLKIYSNQFTKSRRSLTEIINFDENIDTTEKFYNLVYFFLNSNYLTYNDADKHSHKTERKLWTLRKALKNLNCYKQSQTNIILFSKDSLSNKLVNSQVLIDSYLKFVEFFQLVNICKNDLKTRQRYIDTYYNTGAFKHQTSLLKRQTERTFGQALSALSQNMFQIIRDVSIVIFKSVIYIICYLNQIHYITKGVILKLDPLKETILEAAKTQVLTDEMKKSEELVNKITNMIVLFREFRSAFINLLANYSVCDLPHKGDVELFLPADFQKLILTYTIMFLELVMFKCDYNWNKHKYVKIILFDLMKLIKIIPTLNTYYRYFQNGSYYYFKVFRDAYATWTYEFGMHVLEYLKHYSSFEEK